jgi:outer membrane protein assembly factor BamB
VVFGTKEGNVVCIGAERPRFIWQFDVYGELAEALVPDGRSVYVASTNTYVHCIEADNGRLVWKQRTEAILTTAPVVSDRAVYQYVDKSGLLSLDKETGLPRWKIAGGRGLLSEDGNTVYILTLGGWLTAIDDPGGKQLYSVSLGGASCFVTNLVDAAMYVSDDVGRVAALAPRR